MALTVLYVPVLTALTVVYGQNLALPVLYLTVLMAVTVLYVPVLMALTVLYGLDCLMCALNPKAGGDAVPREQAGGAAVPNSCHDNPHARARAHGNVLRKPFGLLGAMERAARPRAGARDPADSARDPARALAAQGRAPVASHDLEPGGAASFGFRRGGPPPVPSLPLLILYSRYRSWKVLEP